MEKQFTLNVGDEKSVKAGKSIKLYEGRYVIIVPPDGVLNMQFDSIYPVDEKQGFVPPALEKDI